MEEKFGHDDIRLEKITDGYAGRSCISAGKRINCTAGGFADCTCIMNRDQ